MATDHSIWGFEQLVAALARELDLWQAALKTGLQEWHLLQREKQRLEQQAPK